MTFTEAAEVVLRQIGKPLHFKKITQLAIEQNLLSHVGKTPEITMSTRLTTMIKKDKGDAPIIRVKPGVFALRVWGEAAVEAAADVEESEEPVLPEGADEEAEKEEMHPPSAEEREREDLLNIAQTIFAAEDDDDLPVLADPPPKPAPAPAAAAADAAAGEGGRRRRRRRRRRGGDRAELAPDGTPIAADGDELEGDDEESDGEPELRADAGEGDEPREEGATPEGAEGAEAAPRAEGTEAPADGAEPREVRPYRSERGERPAGDRAERPERERGRGRDRGDRGERGERAASADRANGERPAADRADRADRGERSDRADRGDRADRSERGDRSERDRGERDRERGERDRDRGDRSDRADRDRAPTEDTTVEAGRDAADLVVSLLQRRDDRNAVPFRTLVDDAIRGNRLSGDANVLAASLAASARADTARREARGERARLRVQGSRVSLVEWSLGGEVARAEDEALVALERLRDAARRQLVRKLNELPQSAFIEMIAVTLERVGLTNLRSIRRAGASQGELFVTGTARVAGEEIPAAVLLKRGGEVGRERVIELRGSMHHFNHARAAWIVTTGSVLSGAREEANSPEAAPVTLVDGQLLSRWMDDHGVGVRHARIAVPYVDLDLFDALRG
jgi:restriction endonuclease Mrr